MGWLLQVLLACLLVGVLLTWLGVNPFDLWRGLRDAVEAAPGTLTGLTGELWPYIATGAVIVVPLVVIGLLLRLVSGRRGPPKSGY